MLSRARLEGSGITTPWKAIASMPVMLDPINVTAPVVKSMVCSVLSFLDANIVVPSKAIALNLALVVGVRERLHVANPVVGLTVWSSLSTAESA